MDTKPEEILELKPAGAPPAPISARVRDLTVKVKKITTTDEGRLQIVLESEGMDDGALAQVKELLVLQQSSLVGVSMDPLQRDIFDS